MRSVMLAGVLAFIVWILLAGRRLGLNELASVGAIVCIVLLADGLRSIIAQVIRGYRTEG